MNRFGALIVILGVAAASAPGQAHDRDACLPMENTDTLVCRHYFERTSIELPVRETLDLIDTECDELVVTVLQRQGVLLAELDEPQEFHAEECSNLTSFRVELPDVRSEVDLLVQLSLPSSASTGTIALRVYPDTLLEPLARFAEEHTLVVFDEDGALTAFLDRNGIDYAQGFEAVTEASVALLVKPREPERFLDDRGIDTAIVFLEKIIDLPQIRTVTNKDQTRVYVETPLLHDLDDNPLAQKALMNVIRFALNPLFTDRG